MRPLSLEMTAFGSYAERTLLPFEELLYHVLVLVIEFLCGGAGDGRLYQAFSVCHEMCAGVCCVVGCGACKERAVGAAA